VPTAHIIKLVETLTTTIALVRPHSNKPLVECFTLRRISKHRSRKPVEFPCDLAIIITLADSLEEITCTNIA